MTAGIAGVRRQIGSIRAEVEFVMVLAYDFCILPSYETV